MTENPKNHSEVGAQQCKQSQMNAALQARRSLAVDISDLTQDEALAVSECHEIAYDGDPKVGTVYHLNQLHAVENLNERQFLVVSESQKRVLKKLNEINPDVVVSETFNELGEFYLFVNIFYDRLLKEGIKSLGPQDLERIRFELIGANDKSDLLNVYRDQPETEVWVNKIFPEGQNTDWENLDRDQKMILISVGADSLYAFFSSTPIINDYPEQEMEIKEDDYIHGEREQKLTQTVRNYLKDSPGKTVAITYGGLHNLSNEFSCSSNCPVFKEVQFPDVEGYEFFSDRQNVERKFGLVPWNPDFGVDFLMVDPAGEIDASDARELWE